VCPIRRNTPGRKKGTGSKSHPAGRKLGAQFGRSTTTVPKGEPKVGDLQKESRTVGLQFWFPPRGAGGNGLRKKGPRGKGGPRDGTTQLGINGEKFKIF